MSTTQITPISVAAGPTQELTDLQAVSLFVVVGLLLTAVLVALGFGPDIAEALTSYVTLKVH